MGGRAAGVRLRGPRHDHAGSRSRALGRAAAGRRWRGARRPRGCGWRRPPTRTSSPHRISAVDNARIDTAWLWPVRETHRKVARTPASALQLAETRPDQVFAFSQAQQLDRLRAERPALYERVRAGRGQPDRPIRGLWVEPDGNLPGGEAMVPQMLYGKRLFLEEFGIETEEVWMPDSFGYSAALPQLAPLAGNRFMLSRSCPGTGPTAFRTTRSGRIEPSWGAWGLLALEAQGCSSCPRSTQQAGRRPGGIRWRRRPRRCGWSARCGPRRG